MKWFNNMKIASKLITAFVLVAVISGIIGYIGIKNINAIEQADTDLYVKMTAPMGELVAITTDFERCRVYSRQMILDQAPQDIEQSEQKIRESLSDLEKQANSFEKTIVTENGKKVFAEFKQSFEDYQRALQDIMNQARNNQDAQALAMMASGSPAGQVTQDLQDKVASLVEMKVAVAKQTSDANSALASSATSTMLIIISLGLLLSIALGFGIARAISRPVQALASGADKLALGDVDVDIQIDQRDEVGQLAASFKTMAENIKGHSLAAQQVARGDLGVQVRISSDKDILGQNLSAMVQNIKDLVEETNAMSQAAVAGNLQKRGNADKFHGGFQEIIKGVNQTLDAVLEPINEAVVCLKEMARGNLDVQVQGDYQGDHAMIKDALNTSLQSINEILTQVSVAVDQVAAGSRQISEASQALSQGATESAGAVEEISASMQEMASQTTQNAENAVQANQLAMQAKNNAENGNQRMLEMVQAMSNINESATNISKIIKVIDEIAFQTNLLALNAAVEAARAGKHGKGFTVVAEEVRNLAQRSAKAAKETTEMIEDSIKKTELGTKIAQDTSGALEEIVSGATKVTDLISEIAAASKEQAQGIGQINQGLSQVDQVTQQNTASAEQSASAGEELSGQAMQLKSMLGRFKLRRQSFGQLSYAASIPQQPEQRVRTQQGKKKTVRPEDIISLDDQDFGSF